MEPDLFAVGRVEERDLQASEVERAPSHRPRVALGLGKRLLGRHADPLGLHDAEDLAINREGVVCRASIRGVFSECEPAAAAEQIGSAAWTRLPTGGDQAWIDPLATRLPFVLVNPCPGHRRKCTATEPAPWAVCGWRGYGETVEGGSARPTTQPGGLT